LKFIPGSLLPTYNKHPSDESILEDPFGPPKNIVYVFPDVKISALSSNVVVLSTATTDADVLSAVLYTMSPTDASLKFPKIDTNLFVDVADAVPDSTGRLGAGIGNVSLAIISNATPVFTVIFGFSFCFFLRVKNLVYFL